jgi:hypothetical protein
LRGVGIEYGDARLPGTGKRVKSLKKIAEIDRHAQQKDPQNDRARRDDGDGRDDSRPHAKEGNSWASDPMRHYGRGGTA